MIKKLSIKAVEKKIEYEINLWPGNCYRIAKKMLDREIVEGKLRYGHWLGPIAKGTMFDHGLGFARHGWIENGKTIIDPTRWVFEDVKPYIYIGASKGYYDVGGQKLRKTLMRPPPKFNKEPELKKFREEIDGEIYLFLTELVDHPYLTTSGMFWIANLPPKTFGNYAKEIYEALDEARILSYVPMDFQNLILE